MQINERFDIPSRNLSSYFDTAVLNTGTVSSTEPGALDGIDNLPTSGIANGGACLDILSNVESLTGIHDLRRRGRVRKTLGGVEGASRYVVNSAIYNSSFANVIRCESRRNI